MIKSGNLLEDITDHLPGYVLIIRKEKDHNADRPMVRIFSPKNINEFIDKLRATELSPVTNEVNIYICFNKFMSTLSNAFNDSFRLVKLSRRRDKDKKWITGALKKSTAVKKTNCINDSL